MAHAPHGYSKLPISGLAPSPIFDLFTPPIPMTTAPSDRTSNAAEPTGPACSLPSRPKPAPSPEAAGEATLALPGRDEPMALPVWVGTEDEHAVDITKLRAETGHITIDSGFGNTGSCASGITYIDGEQGILRYRGYPIDQLAENGTFVETAWLLLYGELPTRQELDGFEALLVKHQNLHADIDHGFDAFRADAHPMAVLSSMINIVSSYHPEVMDPESDDFDFHLAAAKLIAKVPCVAAMHHRQRLGKSTREAKLGLRYVPNFLNMMFASDIHEDEDVVAALRLFLILHADHEQNCSTSTVRMVGSSGANLFASVSAGVCALWGPLHGGANMAVIKMLNEVHYAGVKIPDFMDKVRNKEAKLMGFGHRVYKSFDPRANILKSAADRILAKLGVNDPLLGIARELEEIALNDDYFKERNLYPNVDFYSGLILKAIGIPLNMFTVMFAMGRMPGWIAHWKEANDDPRKRISRPRQVYTGPAQREYVPIDQRG